MAAEPEDVDDDAIDEARSDDAADEMSEDRQELAAAQRPGPSDAVTASLPTAPAPGTERHYAAPGLAEQTPSTDGLSQSLQQAVRDLEAQLIGGERSMKRRQVAADVGVSILSARKIWRALGFPNLGDDDKFFTPQDEQGLRRVVELVRQGSLSEDTTISLARSVGQMTDRIVVWQVETMVEEIVAQRGLTDAQARAEVVRALPDLIEPLEEMLVYAWRRQMAAGVQRMAVRALPELQTSSKHSDEEEPLPLARAVGFADLVSYTSLSRTMNEKALAQMVQRFESKAAEIIAVGGGRLIKTVGDEVLYTAETPAAGAEIALTLVKTLGEDELLPQVRGAMVWGRLLSRLGDVYGPTVNLAARLMALTEPDMVLVDEFTAGALRADPRYVCTPREPSEVRGFGEVTPVQLQRGEGPGMVVD